MTLLFEATRARPSRLEVTLDMASLPAMDAFLLRLASGWNWNEAAVRRLRSAGEETLAFLTDEEAVPSVDDMSLRLLRHHASAVRHQKYHGVDIVTVHAESNP